MNLAIPHVSIFFFFEEIIHRVRSYAMILMTSSILAEDRRESRSSSERSATWLFVVAQFIAFCYHEHICHIITFHEGAQAESIAPQASVVVSRESMMMIKRTWCILEIWSHV